MGVRANKIAGFSNLGMKRDLSPSKADNKFAFENHNIRITEMDGDTLLSVTNERGTEAIEFEETIYGRVVGHCVVNNYLVLFTKDDAGDSETDYIYRIDYDNGSFSEPTKLYSGSLSLGDEIETIGLYETDEIIKVYWVDNVNQPRMINILDEDSIETYTDTSFDFTVDLGSSLASASMSIEKGDATGRFPSGAVQYFFTVSRDNAQESSIIRSSSILFLTRDSKAISEDGISSSSVDISISIDEDLLKYDNINIYCVHRTSLDATPTARLVASLDIDSSTTSYTYTDTGIYGQAIDVSELYYKGGDVFVAKTLAHKDNVLFLGNLSIDTSDAFETIKDYIEETDDAVTIESAYRNLVIGDDVSDVSAFNYYITDSNRACYFRQLNYYRIGIQFKDSRGKWSEPICVEDYMQMDKGKRPSIVNISGVTCLRLPTFTVELSSDLKSLASSLNYETLRVVVVYPTEAERVVVAQGVLNPTVFTPQDRNGSASFSSPYWFYKTFDPDDYGNTTEKQYHFLDGSSNVIDVLDETLGVVVGSPNADIQSQYNVSEDQSVVDSMYPYFYKYQAALTEDTPLIVAEEETAQLINSGYFAFDYNFVTLNSPDVDDIEDGDDVALHVIGYEEQDYHITNNRATMTSAGFGTHAYFYNYDDSDYRGTSSTDNTTFSLYTDSVSWHWLYGTYTGSEVILTDSTVVDNTNLYFEYVVYPWHKSGSLNSSFSGTDIHDNEYQINAQYSDKIYADFKYFSELKELSTAQKYSSVGVAVFDPSVDFCTLDVADSLSYYDSNKTYRGNQYTSVYPFNGVAPIMVNTKVHDAESGIGGAGYNYARGGSSNVYRPTGISSYYSGYYMPLARFLVQGESNYDSEPPIYYDTDEGAISGDVKNYPGYTAQACLIKHKSEKHAVIGLGTFHDETTSNSGQYVLGVGDYTYTMTDTKDAIGWFFKNQRVLQIDFCTSKDETGAFSSEPSNNFMLIGELIREEVDPTSLFGGTSDAAKRNNLWIPASSEFDFTDDDDITITCDIGGDSYYCRWDSLKTYPYSDDDDNKVIEIGSFMIESYRNLNGRYDNYMGATDYSYANPLNFGLYNDVWNQKDNFFSYRITDMEDVSGGTFPNQFAWSLEKSYGEDIDSWTQMTLASIYNADGDKGEIQAIRKHNNELLGFQDKGIFQILFNSRSQIATTTGVPIELANSGKVDGVRYVTNTAGCTNARSIVSAPTGLYFIDDLNASLMCFGSDGLQNVSTKHGFDRWFREMIDSDVTEQSYYDSVYNDIYLNFKGNTTLVYSEKLGNFMTFADYQDTSLMCPIQNRFVSFKSDLNSDSSQYSSTMWLNHEGDFCCFYGTDYPYYMQYRINADPYTDKTFNNIEYIATTTNTSEDTDLHETFDTIQCQTDYQDSGAVTIDISKYVPGTTGRQRFRVWRVNIPRDAGSIDRIRGPWMTMTLTKTKDEENRYKLMEFHNLLVRYSV